jgi:hypothetical protein
MTRPVAGIFYATICLVLTALLSLPAEAHESRPAYLSITEVAAGQYDLTWKVPRRGELVLPLYVNLPERCTDLTPVGQYFSPGAVIVRRSVDCGEPGMQGGEVSIDGLSGTITDALARVSLLNGQTQTVILRSESPTFTVAEQQSAWDVFVAYLVLGTEHILFGIDHLLFVLGLLLIVRGVALLIKTITAFTLAHSITLGLAALGFVRVPQAPVEAFIALSILFLATELVRQRHGEIGLAERYPWLVALSFGLLHGFGFAGALSEVGLPQTDIPLALFSFNVGVEVGQLLFVVAALIVIRLLARLHLNWPAWAELVPAYSIGSLAAFWCIQRVAAF